jgi:Galactose oxidase, central domain/Kelch motif
MKKQINPNIKAHLIRSAFYVLLLLAVCAIPFALAQRNTTKRSVAKPKVTVTAGTKTRPLPPQGTCPTPWNSVADMPLDLYGAASASDGTFYYSAGGYSFSFPGTVNVFNRYDPVANTWTPLEPMPTGAAMAVGVYYPPTNKFYVFGGAEFDSGTNYDLTQIYDIATNTWSSGAPMPDVRSFSAGGYVSATGKIYIISGYNTGTVDSAQPNTWEYDPVADSWNDLTGTLPFPHPAGGFAFGVINDKLYIAGGRDAGNNLINLNWEFDPVAVTYTPKADMPGSQPNVRGSAVALDALFAFGGGNPFLAPESVPTRAASAAGEAAPGSAKVARDSAKTAPTRSFDPATIKSKPLVPTTTSRTNVYDPSMDQWTTSANMNIPRSFPSGAFISGSNVIIASGGVDGNIFFTTATAEVLTPCIPPTPTPCPPTPTPTPPCGLLIGDGLTIGFAPSGYQDIASNIVNYTFSSSVSAPGDFAIFETHDPWGATVIKDAITAAGHTFAEFTPADLAGFDFSQYRVVILNWDDTFLTDFGGSAACGGGAYISALPALEAYSAAGGVVWVQGAIQGSEGDCFPLPFGGQSCIDFSSEDPIADACSPEVIGVSDPIEGNFASHTADTDLPAAAHIVVINGTDSNPVLYHLACATPQPTPTPTPPLGCNTGLIHNGGFESGNLTSWVIDSTVPSPVVTNALSHSGRFSAFAGGNPPALQFCGFGGEPDGDSSFYQEFGPVPANATLSFWHWDCTTDVITFDWQDAYITDTNGNILQTIYHRCANCESWVHETVDLSSYAGQTIRVKFLVHQDGFGDITSMLVDEVGLFVPGPCASPTPRPTPSPRGQPTPHPRP